MKLRTSDILIIGGGPAGLAAAIAAKKAGVDSVLVIDREEAPGGILKQCIHNGFGLHTFNEELTGPEYARRFTDEAEALGVEILTDTMAIGLTRDKRATVASATLGVFEIQAKAVILAMGCRERPRGSLATPGTRPSGIYTAGTAQKLVNRLGLMPGKRVVILGSGDIGLIMARRMTFMGAKVLACVELMPYSAGLTRNIVQCLNDFDIPLYLSHTVTDIEGKERLEAVTIAEVDSSLRPSAGSEKRIECDTLLLSVGLIPENELAKQAGVTLSRATNGAEVDESLETNIDGIFSSGNVLHVHDLVDFVSEEAARAGEAAARRVQGEARKTSRVSVISGEGVGGATPQYISEEIASPVRIMFRPKGVYKRAKVIVERGGEVIAKQSAMILTPGEMVNIELKREAFAKGCGDVRVYIEPQEGQEGK